MTIVHQDVNFYNSPNCTRQGTSSQRTQHLISHLHRGGKWVHFQDGGENGGYRESHWVPVGKTFVPPASWWQQRNIFFTVNPGNKNRGPKRATHNEDIVAANALFAEFDGKDEVLEDEWL